MDESRVVDTLLLYQRQGDHVRVKLDGMTNHELRTVLIGLWLRLDAEDAADFVKEIIHYADDPDSVLPPLARAIAIGEGRNPVDIAQRVREEFNDGE